MKRILLATLALTLILGTITSAGEIIKLPAPNTVGRQALERTIENRRSVRSFSNDELSLQEISQLLWSAQGITDKDWNFRAAPSAGALYPLEIYVAKLDGLFHYLPEKHVLEKKSSEDLRNAIGQAALGQAFVKNAPTLFIITAAYERTRAKYGARAERYVYAECGHAAENLHLQAVSLGLGSVAVAAFWDDIVAKVLKLPENQYPLYIIPVGYPR